MRPIRGRIAWLTALLVGASFVQAAAQTRTGIGFQGPPADTEVPGFGQVEHLPPIPGFGDHSGLSLRIEPEDLERVDRTFDRYDRNRDRYIDRREAEGGRWRDDPFQYDKNGDNRLSRDELALRYATRRTNEENPSWRRIPPPSSTGSPSDRHRSEDEERRRREEERRRQYARGRETWGLVESLMRRYDHNRDGRLSPDEWRSMGAETAASDPDGDGRIDRGELFQWLVTQKESAAPPLPEGLPDWFAPRDRNGDGQIMMSEFAEDWNDDTAVEFSAFDLNNDGVILPEECLKAATHRAGNYSNDEFKVIPAGGTVYSRILVQDDVPIADLNVQVSITHTHDDHLDAFLIDPTGNRVELFTGVGGSDDHFDNTILDDEAPAPIVRARPPFSGRYQPEALTKGQPSLRQYRGSSIEGTWTLLIRAERSDREGVLHGWSLLATPLEDRADDEMDEHGGPPSGGRTYSREDDDDRPESQGFEERREEYRRWPPRGGWGRGRPDD